jgi:hypothetical protein
MIMPNNSDIAIVSPEVKKESPVALARGIEAKHGPLRVLPGGGKLVRMREGQTKYCSARGLHDALRCGGVIVDDNPPQFQYGPSVAEQQGEALRDLAARESSAQSSRS